MPTRRHFLIARGSRSRPSSSRRIFRRRTSAGGSWPSTSRGGGRHHARRRAPARFYGHAGRRSGEAGRQHDNGLGVEGRVPFLDHELVELAAACPPELKLAHGGKGVLKNAARALLPSEIIDRPKGYFPVPGIRHLEGQLLETVRAALTNQAARARGLF